MNTCFVQRNGQTLDLYESLPSMRKNRGKIKTTRKMDP